MTYAQEKIERFQKRFQKEYGMGHFYFACHAAFPIGFSVDFLYQLWANFKDKLGAERDLERLVVSDLLHSGLCRRADKLIFEMELEVRNYLLKILKNKYGEDRLLALAQFLYQYVEQNITDDYYRGYRDTQKWVALATIRPHLAGEQLAGYFGQQISKDNKAEVSRLDGLFEALNSQDNSFSSLRAFSKGIKANLRGENAETLQNTFNQVIRIKENLVGRAEGLRIPLPKNLQQENLQFQKELENEQELEVHREIQKVKNGRSTELVLSGLGLNSIPEEVFSLKQLTVLDVYDNEITAIPALISSLENLEKLLISKNQISDFTASLGQLQKLKVLKADDNQLEEIPEVIYQLKALEDLSLENNQIDVLPFELGQLESLRLLDLRGNPILNVEEGIRLKFSKGTLMRLLNSIRTSNTEKAVMLLFAPEEEVKAIVSTLNPLINSGQLQIEYPKELTPAAFFKACRTYANQLQVVHFSYNNTDRDFRFPLAKLQSSILGKTFQRLLGKIERLPFCFLNANIKKENTTSLLEGVVEACLVRDGEDGFLPVPQDAAVQFYATLVKGDTLKEAFDQTLGKQEQYVQNVGSRTPFTSGDTTYNLYAKEDKAAYLDWKLVSPEESNGASSLEEEIPLIVLSFPDSKASFSSVNREFKALRNQFDPFVKKGALAVKYITYTTPRGILSELDRIKDQVSGFHFMSGPDNSIFREVGEELSTLLGSMSQLKYVFLSGCGNTSMIRGLLTTGAGAIVSTNRRLSSDSSYEFARRFYQVLLDGGSVRNAMESLDKYFQSIKSEVPYGGILGNVPVYSEKPEEVPWAIYVQFEELMDWQLLKKGALQAGKAIHVYNNFKSYSKIEGESEEQAIDRVFTSYDFGGKLTFRKLFAMKELEGDSEDILFLHFSDFERGGNEYILEIVQKMPHLKFIFLNGNQTDFFVRELFAVGVPVVIASDYSIEEKDTSFFAKTFYEALIREESIERALEAVQTEMHTQSLSSKSASFSRFPYRLHINPNNAGAERWSLKAFLQRGTIAP